MSAVTRGLSERESAVMDCCAQNMSVNQTARALRLTPGQVSAVRVRLGLVFRRAASSDAIKPLTYRDVIADMKPLEAVDYLCELLDQLAWNPQEQGREPIVGVRLTPKEAQLLYLLWKAGGKGVAVAHILALLYADRSSGEVPSPQVIKVFACHISRKLSGHGRVISLNRRFALHLNPGVSLDWTRGLLPPFQTPHV